MRRYAMLLSLALCLPTFLSAQEPKGGSKPMVGVSLEVVAKKDVYVFDGGGKSPAEYKQHLETIAAHLKKGEFVEPPKPLSVDLVLRLTNTTQEPITIYVGGDPNIYTFTLSGGAGVVTMNNPVAFTTDFRLPKAVTLAPGKSYEQPVRMLADGHRGFTRLLFWTGPGEYTLAAEYTLADAEGRKTATVKSAPVKITVKDK